MITWELILAISAYNFVMYVTPGPNNSILTASGIKFGFFRSVPNIFGIPTGHGIQLALVCLGLGSLFTQFPILLNILRYVGAVYILYLAYKMFGSLNVSSTEEKSRPLKYYEAILFQFVNPKAWTVAIMVASGFFPKDEILIIAILFSSLTAAIVCFPSICLWALFGSSIRLIIKNTKIKKVVEFLLAFLLLVTAIIIIIN